MQQKAASPVREAARCELELFGFTCGNGPGRDPDHGRGHRPGPSHDPRSCRRTGRDPGWAEK